MDHSYTATPVPRFEYEDERLNSCAEWLKTNDDSEYELDLDMEDDATTSSSFSLEQTENQRRQHITEDTKATIVEHAYDASCRVLYESHQLHYNRSSSQTQSNERYNSFLTSVRLLHRHNNNSQQQRGRELFTVRLNQFSDLTKDHPDIPHTAEVDDDEEGMEDGDTNIGIERIERMMNTAASLENPNIHIRPMKLVRLESMRDIRKALPKLFVDFLTPEFPNNTSSSHDDSTAATTGDDNRDRDPKNRLLAGPWHSSSYNDISTEAASDTTQSDGSSNTDIQGFGLDNDDKYLRHLNWATENNPDGVVLVHPASFQGSCGSCWAFAATGTLEASISRHSAYTKFQSIKKNVEHNPQIPSPNEAEYTSSTVEYQASSMSKAFQHQHAISTAQNTERKTFQRAHLSVQELIDCDNKHDHGCTGGNPLLAYPFIHRYGLVSEEVYPYQAFESKCRRKEITTTLSEGASSSSSSSASYTLYDEWDHPPPPIDIATANSWGVLAPNDEENMESVLRYVGPIAVGFDGSDPSFLGYEGGVYDCEGCIARLNHALLIVGYSEMEDGEGGLLKYWIARNSWGEAWGENGYVRIKRGGLDNGHATRKGGKKGSSGVCGIAKNPNVALGGYFLSVDDAGNTAILGNTDNSTIPSTTYEGVRRPGGVRAGYDMRVDQSRLSSGAEGYSTWNNYRLDASWFTMCCIVATTVLGGLIISRQTKYRKRIRCGLASTTHATKVEIDSSETSCIVESLNTRNNMMYGSLDNNKLITLDNE